MFTRIFLLAALLFSTCTFFLSGCSEKNNGTYKIGLDPLWYPLDFKGQENNVMGFSTELLTEISKNEKLYLSLLNTNWDSLFQGLRAGTYQAVLSSLPPYNFNLKQYDFSDLYLPLGPVLILPSSSKTTSLTKMNGKEIGVIIGSSSILILETYPEISIQTYGSASALINDLLMGNIDGALLPILIAESFTRGSFTDSIKIVSKPLNNEGLRILTLKGKSPNLLKYFNKGLKHLENTGKYSKLLKEWQLIETSP